MTETTPLPTKKPWMSKTLWLALFAAITPFFPVVDTWVAANPSYYIMGISALFAGLRVISKGKLTIE